MSSFFTVPNSAKKRKRTAVSASGGKHKKSRESYLQDRSGGKKAKPVDDEDISSESEGESEDGKAIATDDEEEDEYEGETAAEKRLRLAQQYLDNLKQETGKTRNCGSTGEVLHADTLRYR